VSLFDPFDANLSLSALVTRMDVTSDMTYSKYNVHTRTIIFECDIASMQGLGHTHRSQRKDSENQIISILEYHAKFGRYISMTTIHKISNLNMLTLRKALVRMTREGILKLYRGSRNSKLYCISGLEEHFEYLRLVKEYPLGEAEAHKLFSEDFIKNESGYYRRKSRDTHTDLIP